MCVRLLKSIMSQTILPYDSSLSRFPVLGLPVHLIDNYTNWLLKRWQQGLGTHVITLNAEMAIQAEKNPELANVIHAAELVIPDGAGVVLYLQYKGQKIQRCPGIELAESVIENIGKLEDSEIIFFYGGKPGIAQKAADNIQQKFPSLEISSYHGYLSTSEEEDLKTTLKELQPRLILVGLGVPRQEFWIQQNRHLVKIQQPLQWLKWQEYQRRGGLATYRPIFVAACLRYQLG